MADQLPSQVDSFKISNRPDSTVQYESGITSVHIHHNQNTLTSTKSSVSTVSSVSSSSSSGVSSAESHPDSRSAGEEEEEEHIYDQTTDEYFYSEPKATDSDRHLNQNNLSSFGHKSISSDSITVRSPTESTNSFQNRLKRKPISALDWQHIYEDLDMHQRQNFPQHSSTVAEQHRSQQHQLMHLHKLQLHQQTQQFVASQQRLLNGGPAQMPSKFVPASGVYVTCSVSVQKHYFINIAFICLLCCFKYGVC